MVEINLTTVKLLWLGAVLLWAPPLGVFAQPSNPQTTPPESAVAPPAFSAWLGKYPMSFWTKTRSANTVGKDHISFSLKMQYFDYDKVMDSSGYYQGLGEDNKAMFSSVLVTKYGWARDHHLALGIPYIWNNSEINNNTFNNNGLGNIFIFEKWNPIKETEYTPAVAFDVWHYFGTGNSTRKVGSDDYAWKFTTEISKAWEGFSVHLNPGYLIGEGRDCDIVEANAAVLFKPWETFWPGLEYNYMHKETKGNCQDLIPGFIWKVVPKASIKLGAVINLDSSMKYKDEVSVVLKLFYKF